MTTRGPGGFQREVSQPRMLLPLWPTSAYALAAHPSEELYPKSLLLQDPASLA